MPTPAGLPIGLPLPPLCARADMLPDRGGVGERADKLSLCPRLHHTLWPFSNVRGCFLFFLCANWGANISPFFGGARNRRRGGTKYALQRCLTAQETIVKPPLLHRGA